MFIDWNIDADEACCGAVVQGLGGGSAIARFGVQGGASVKRDGGSGTIVRVEAQDGGTIVEGGVVSIVKAVVGAEVEGKATKKPPWW